MKIPVKVNAKPFEMFHSVNMDELPDWDLCGWCGCLWNGNKKISFLKKNCYNCEGSIITKDYETFFGKL